MQIYCIGFLAIQFLVKLNLPYSKTAVRFPKPYLKQKRLEQEFYLIRLPHHLLPDFAPSPFLKMTAQT